MLKNTRGAMKRRLNPNSFIAIAAVMAAAILPLSAQETGVERVSVGTLTCKSEGARELTEPVIRSISCTFERTGKGEGGAYAGDLIHKGPSGPAALTDASEILVWNVWAPKGRTGDLDLLGKYFGVREDDPATPGLGANTLVGGAEKGILLEPVINPEAIQGPADSRTVVELELKPAKT